MSIFTIEITRSGKYGMSTCASLEMPATWAEIEDAKDKVRIKDKRDTYSYEFVRGKYDWLTRHLPDNADLTELNLLASRMEKDIKGDLDVFEAMVKIETEKNGGRPPALCRLISLTFSTGNCYVAGSVTGDALLGRFLYENDMLPAEVHDFAAARIAGGRETADERFKLIGREHREANGGVFTGSGRYAEFDGCVNEVYAPGAAEHSVQPGAPVTLKISRGFGLFDTSSAHEGDHIVTLELPEVHGNETALALDAAGAASAKEIGYLCSDCLIPSAKKWIDNAQNPEQAHEFAKALDSIKQNGRVKEYKALLEAAGCDSLDTALSLYEGIGEYQLAAGCPGPEAYALEAFKRPEFAGISEELCMHVSLYGFGLALLAQDNTADTSYGMLSRRDGGPLFAQSGQPAAGMEMR